MSLPVCVPVSVPFVCCDSAFACVPLSVLSVFLLFICVCAVCAGVCVGVNVCSSGCVDQSTVASDTKCVALYVSAIAGNFNY